jgi:erythritol transport system permease protein
MQGLPVRKLEITTFVVSGAAAGLAGGIYLSQYQLVNLFAGTGLGFQAITIVIVGGASVLGGSGTVVGTVVSALLISAMANGLAVLGLSNYWQGTGLGLLLPARIPPGIPAGADRIPWVCLLPALLNF